ncbi:MAG: polysaccharide biosynthesis protein [Flavobacteriales bacterium]|nr:polysaccharide biosynthesis protein [Flavobacteriales bacterium]
MLLNYLRPLTNRHIPRWVILNVDLLISALTFLFSFAIIHNLRMDWFTFDDLVYPTLLVVSFRLFSFLVTQSYRGIIKFTSSQDAIRIFSALSISSFGIFMVREVYLLRTGIVLIPLSVLVMDYFILLALLTSFRLGLKILYREITNHGYEKRNNVIIYGAGHTGMIAKRSIDSALHSHLKVVAFFDDNKKMEGKTAEGLPIYHFNKRFDWAVQKYKPSELIIALTDLPGYKKKRIIELGLKHNLVIKNVPQVDKWINGEFSFNQIKSVNIEDLLGRDPILLDKQNIKEFIQGKTVLITGAAGSIGSEIARQCFAYHPEKLILLDQAETPLYELEYELSTSPIVEVVVADVTNKGRMEKVFRTFGPQVVFHAAAYKHVPLMEDNPYEALNTNVFGTKLLADLSVKYFTEKFVFISTDKAVNPTNIMGASKRMAEMYVQSLNLKLSVLEDSHTRFITTRFGNVLGSNGSVIPRFKQQIEQGGPITVTHPEITRYFMTIPEACQLVLEAGSMGDGGEIYIFDMGESVRIVDLARKMIKLSGFEEGRDIEIIFTGLRPGEKLNEELLNQKENTIGTHHPKIMVAQVANYKYDEVRDLIEALFKDRDHITNKLIVRAMKQLIPEYISNNSIYEELDKLPRTAKIAAN